MDAPKKVESASSGHQSKSFAPVPCFGNDEGQAEWGMAYAHALPCRGNVLAGTASMHFCVIIP